MLDKIIAYSFYALFFLTPLFWNSLNYELFEFNKMLLTYGITVVIVGCWILKMVNRKSIIIHHTPLDIPLLLFLGANILSTIFSIDTHTSIWGYYSRLNGGLLSTVTYLLLYWAFVSNMDKGKVLTLLKFGLASGFIISLYAISEHFGVSPSCIFLRGEFNADCWVQKVQERVFATLGQPNWLAAYLSMLIFPAFYFFLTSKGRKSQTTYYILLTTYYLAFTFTYSRGPTLGLVGGFLVFLALLYFERKREVSLKTIINFKEFSHFVRNIKPVLFIIGSFLIINLLFGSALTSFRLISKFAAPLRGDINLAPSGTQLENGGTESGEIRLIVWRGALDIFKHYPIFGSGVETFAYSYYKFRPQVHNNTTEWDFLYNKAHNEYLNYLATTGIVGTGTYILVIGTFLWWSIKKMLVSSQTLLDSRLLILVTLSSYISYLIYNIFLFSVVIIAIFFFLFPALAFVYTKSIQPLKLPRLFTIHYSLFTLIYRRPAYTKAFKIIILFSIFYFLFSIFKIWYADVLFAKGEKASDSGSPGKAYNLLSTAIYLNPSEPFYRSEFANSAAQVAVSLNETDASDSAEIRDEALNELSNVLKNSPNNVSFWRSAIRTYFELASLDKKYVEETLNALDQTIKLAPTDPKLYYNKALILDSQNKKDQAIEALKKAIELRSNYLEAKQKLEEATASAKP